MMVHPVTGIACRRAHVAYNTLKTWDRYIMELACPNCDTRFKVPDGAIGDDGRKVRCSACSHQWRAYPPEHSEPPLELEDEVAPPPPLKEQYSYDDSQAGQQHYHAESYQEEEYYEEEPEQQSRPRSAQAQPPTWDEPAAAAYLFKNPESGGWRIVVGVLLLAIVGGTYFLRNEVVHTFPQAVKLYELAGIPLTNVGKGLEIVDQQWRMNELVGIKSLAVRGSIQNNATFSLSPGPLKVLIFGEDGTQLSEEKQDLAIASVEAGAKADFAFTLPAPSAPVGKVEIIFSNR